MTTDQAIKILGGAIKKPNTKDGYLGQALTMAINALKNQPELANNSPKFANENDELISRQTAIKAICEECDALKPCEAECEWIWAVEELPSVPRKGKWILDNPRSDDSLIYIYACSECHAHHRARYDFCPSCGADMRGDSDDR